MTVGQFRQFAAAKKYKTFAEKNGGGLAWDPKSEAWSQSPSHVWNDAEFGGGESYPVRFVTLADAQAFCAWLGEQDGLRYVVPTEEQWEFACRAGTTTPWSFGDDPAAMEQHGWTKPHAGGEHHPVGRLAANPFGLFDLHGNARELALDARGGPVERGGGEDSSALWARSAVRMPVREPERGDPAAGLPRRGCRRPEPESCPRAAAGEALNCAFSSPPGAQSGPEHGPCHRTFPERTSWSILGLRGGWPNRAGGQKGASTMNVTPQDALVAMRLT